MINQWYILNRKTEKSEGKQRKVCGPAGRPLQRLRRSLEQLAQVIKVNSNLQQSITDHSNYYLYICMMRMLHSSYLQVLSFNDNVIN